MMTCQKSQQSWHLSGSSQHLQARVWCLLSARRFSWQGSRAYETVCGPVGPWNHWNKSKWKSCICWRICLSRMPHLLRQPLYSTTFLQIIILCPALFGWLPVKGRGEQSMKKRIYVRRKTTEKWEKMWEGRWEVQRGRKRRCKEDVWKSIYFLLVHHRTIHLFNPDLTHTSRFVTLFTFWNWQNKEHSLFHCWQSVEVIGWVAAVCGFLNTPKVLAV